MALWERSSWELVHRVMSAGMWRVLRSPEKKWGCLGAVRNWTNTLLGHWDLGTIAWLSHQRDLVYIYKGSFVFYLSKRQFGQNISLGMRWIAELENVWSALRDMSQARGQKEAVLIHRCLLKEVHMRPRCSSHTWVGVFRHLLPLSRSVFFLWTVAFCSYSLWGRKTTPTHGLEAGAIPDGLWTELAQGKEGCCYVLPSMRWFGLIQALCGENSLFWDTYRDRGKLCDSS